ncbi:MAG TPA: hypothetical protein VGF38_22395 [Ktedonobacterales bacterium]
MQGAGAPESVGGAEAGDGEGIGGEPELLVPGEGEHEDRKRQASLCC